MIMPTEEKDFIFRYRLTVVKKKKKINNKIQIVA